MMDMNLGLRQNVNMTAGRLTRTPLPDDERRAASCLLAALDPFREIRGDMPLQYVTTLLLVAANEGLSNQEYSRQAGVSKSVMSRHILDLSIRQRSGGDGLGLLMTRLSPMELRRHEVYLTPRGKAMVHRILRAWRLGCNE